MSPIQQMLLGVGAVATKTYVDDVFSTYLYTGNASDKTITNGIDLAGEGGLTWIKRRNASSDHALVDTERTASQYLSTNNTNADTATGPYNNFNSFTSTGFTLKDDNGNDFFNKNNTPYSSWSFRKAPGFFDCIKYTGDGSASRQISHSLGSVPGMVIVKNIDGGYNWTVWHKSEPTKAAQLNQTAAFGPTTDYFGNSSGPITPTSTYFTVNGNAVQNGNGVDYIAYVFAGGESTAATARSVDFDGSGDYLSLASDAAFQFGTGDFTVEFWWKANSTSQSNYHQTIGTQSVGGTDTGLWRIGTRTNANKVYFSSGTGGGFDEPAWDANVNDMQWHHIAITRASGYIYCYVDGIKLVNSGGTNNITRSLTTSNSLFIGYNTRDGNYINGDLSNVRIVKGTAVYTSSFRPPTEPLTSITNTTLLCCNNSSTTGKTTGGTITANGDPTASTDSPFDDPAGFVFGDAEDQNVIKCGSYIGTGANASWQGNNPVELGFVPQWVMVKRASGIGDWVMVDQMRNQYPFRGRVHANENVAETTSIAVAPSGDLRNYDSGLNFNVRGTDTDVNHDGSTYIYIAIREAAGIVKRPPSLGTEVFTVDKFGNSSSTIPAFDSAFAVNFVLNTIPASSGQNNVMYMRKGSTDYIKLDNNANGTSNANSVWDSNLGWGKNFNSSFCAWMWARYSGAVGRTHYGTGANQDIAHNLGQIPEMMWVRKQAGSGTASSAVYHKALPSNVDLQLDQYYTYPSTDTTTFNQTAPTSTHFTVGTSNRTNGDGNTYFVMLFASVDKISKVDSFDGSNSDLTVTVGFQPRFLMVKQYAATGGTASGDWVIVDTIRGWGSGSDKIRHLNSTSAISDADVGTPTSTGFTLTGNNNDWNQSGKSYIYYAHA